MDPLCITLELPFSFFQDPTSIRNFSDMPKKVPCISEVLHCYLVNPSPVPSGVRGLGFAGFKRVVRPLALKHEWSCRTAYE